MPFASRRTPEPRRGARRLCLLACVALAAGLVASAAESSKDSRRGEYRRLIEQYRKGGTRAAAEQLASWPKSEVGWATASLDCFHRDACVAAAILHLEAAAMLFDRLRPDDAHVQIEAGRAIVRELAIRPAPVLSCPLCPSPPAPERAARVGFDWQLAAGFLQQSYGCHNGAYASRRPCRCGGPAADPRIRPGQAIASGLESRVGSAASRDHVTLLKYLERQYALVLASDGSLVEARLRRGRVLAALGRIAEAVAELRAVLLGRPEPFAAAVAHLCLARLAESADDAAAEYRRAIDLDPALQPAWMGLSEALRRKQDRKGAMDALEHAFAREGDPRLNAWIEYHMGRGRAFPAALARLQEDVRRKEAP